MLFNANLNVIIGAIISIDCSARDAGSVPFNPPRPIGWSFHGHVVTSTVSSRWWIDDAAAFKGRT